MHLDMYNSISNQPLGLHYNHDVSLSLRPLAVSENVYNS